MTWNDRYVAKSHWSNGADVSVDIIGSKVNMPSFVKMKSFPKLYIEPWPRPTMYVLPPLFILTMTDVIAHDWDAPQFSRLYQPYGSQVSK
jgi:hypothetical protein